MSEYVKQAKDFLTSCNATMKITYLGKDTNHNWGESQLRNTYRATIKTPLGSMWVKFWDSINNTQKGIQPTEYDILACLQKYDVGSLEDFANEFGYDLYDDDPWATRNNLKPNPRKIYEAVCNEYEKVCRCFTEEQIEQMWEIA